MRIRLLLMFGLVAARKANPFVALLNKSAALICASMAGGFHQTQLFPSETRCTLVECHWLAWLCLKQVACSQRKRRQ